MGYDISFRVKVEGVDRYIPVGDCDANITWNVGEMIRKSTGLEWENEANNGLVKDIIPYIESGYAKLTQNPEAWKKYEAPNGWGTVNGCIHFFQRILESWEMFKSYYETRDFADIATFWIT